MTVPDNRHPWFAPLYRRIAVVAVCLAWLGLETASGDGLWLAVAAGVTGYAVWALLISYRAAGKAPDAPDESPD